MNTKKESVPAVETMGLTKLYGGKVAVKDLNLRVGEGQIYGFIGRNGAGKSTLIKVLTGINHPDKGEIYIDGKKAEIANPVVSKTLGIGCIYQELNIWDERAEAVYDAIAELEA